MGKLTRERQIEITFIAVFSVLIFLIFYTLISMNGVVLGNDPAVHLEKAQIFLNTGKIPLSNLGWTPPLFEILLAIIIAFSGANNVGQLIFLTKALAAVMDWLLFLSVYLIGSRFFNKKVGAVASVVLLLCFPIYEANAFGGYTTVLAIAYMLLMLLYTSLATERFGYLAVASFSAFGLVLSHQLGAFLAVFVMPPILVYMLVKSKGKNIKVVVALALGGGIAFFLYYFQAMIGYIGLVVEYVFFAVKSYAYQIPSVNFNSLMIDFGVLFLFALAGIAVSFYQLRANQKPLYLLILLLAFCVPLFFAESYLFGLYMPFQWFLYYVTPPMAILAAAAIVFFADKFTAYWGRNKVALRRNWLKVATVALIAISCTMLFFRSDIVYGRIMQASVFYSTTDVKAYDAGVWLSQNYPGNATVVDTQVPGSWFSAISGKTVIAQTDPTVQRNEIAESVLSLSYELQNNQTLLRAYGAKGGITDEDYVCINGVWYRDSYGSTDGDFLNFTQGGINYQFTLTQLARTISFSDNGSPKQITFSYSNNQVLLTQTILVQNNSYVTDVSWTITPLQSDISNVTLYMTRYFDLQFAFEKAQIPQLMNWMNPWNVSWRETGSSWAVANFTGSQLTDGYIGVYDDQKNLAFAFNFTDRPDWGNIGALNNMKIDALRFQYQFSQIGVNQTVTRQYQTLTLAQNTFPSLQPSNLESLLSFNPGIVTVSSHDYQEYIAANNIQFIVYDKNQLDTKLCNCQFLQLIYTNDRYAIFKILPDYNQTET